MKDHDDDILLEPPEGFDMTYYNNMDALMEELRELDRKGPEYEDERNDLESHIFSLLREHWEEIRIELVELLEELKDSEDTELLDIFRRGLEFHQHPPEPFFRADHPTRASRIEYPLDKVNSQIWSLLEEDTNGQLTLKAEKFGSSKPLNIYYAIDFDALAEIEGVTISRRLTAYDKRAYIAISAIYNAGNKVMTLTQIYYAMGYTGKPGKSDLEKINIAVTKMTGARIYVNNEQEAGRYRYAKFVYDGSLLPLERGSAVVNGQLVDAVLHLFREPPVISFAKQRRQITTIDVKLLQSPISKTDQNLVLDDYLIERIARGKKRQKWQRILFKTIYEKTGAKTAKQKQRVVGKVSRYLDHYQKCGMITGYDTGPDGVTVYYEDPTKKEK